MIHNNDSQINCLTKSVRYFLSRAYKLVVRVRNIIWFIIDYLKFVSFIKKQKINKHPKKIDNQLVCIAVIPWLGSSVPWYAITLALMLHQKGKNITILFVDMPFGGDQLFHSLQSKLIYKILRKIPIRIIKLSNYEDYNSHSKQIHYLSQLNSLHATHGETNTELRKSYEHIVEKQLTPIYSKLSSMYKKENLNQIILPGGIWGPSGIISFFAEKHNTQLTSYDSDENELIMSIFGIAAQLKDIPYFFERLMNNPKEKIFAIQKGVEQLQKRREGNDSGSHFTEASNTIEFGNDYYLMLLNSVWDTAALGLHTVYDTMIEWMFDSIDWVLNNTDKTILIRQHPAERVKNIDNTDSYKEKINDKFGTNNRIIFIEAKEDINTYDLIENCFCVLGFSSTIIVESVMLGKPAIIVSNTYFSDLGIVYKASDKKEYYANLLKSSKNQLKISQEMNDRACISNYITQSCNYYKTDFTPVRNNFLSWSNLTLEELEKDYLPLQAILENTPLSILQHERIFNDSK